MKTIIKIDPSASDPSALVNLETILKCNEEHIAKQNARFQEFISKYVEIEEEEAPQEAEETNAPNAPIPDIDPLTAMFMEQEARETRKAELYLKYRKERARRKRGLTVEASNDEEEDDGVDRAALGIIEKDLNRLPHPTESGLGPNAPNLTPKQESRVTWLREILYIYSQVHPEMGYRQGMHEIASYLLFVLELEQSQYPDHPLFQPMLGISFHLLERTLEKLQTAYAVSGEDSLNQMSRSILNKIHQNDPALFQLLATNPNIPPPPIYCTRWVRLLFSREVAGYENVFELWDVFFEYKVMRVLEITCATRILLLRDALLNPDNNPLDLLMNVPQLSDITPLTDTLRSFMEQPDVDASIQLPSSHLFTTPPRRDAPPARPLPQPISHPSQSRGSAQSQGSSDSGKFSFSQMRQTLGQKGVSLRKKIVDEWKQQQEQREDGNSGHFMNAPKANNSFSPTLTPGDPNLFPDPLSHPPSNPLSPKQHQHDMWSQLLKTKIWTVQHYLMKIESKETGQKVPSEVWEALVELDRMQRELHNYSKSTNG